eukprot:2662348-Rhodomonas_salina.1
MARSNRGAELHSTCSKTFIEDSVAREGGWRGGAPVASASASASSRAASFDSEGPGSVDLEVLGADVVCGGAAVVTHPGSTVVMGVIGSGGWTGLRGWRRT